MRVLAFFLTVLLTVNALSTQDQWAHFKAKYGKNYKNIVEEKSRFEVFQDTLKKIKKHNEEYEAGLNTWTMGVNKFSDMTAKEFGDMLKRQNGVRPKIRGSRHIQNLTADVPDAFDWRDKKAVLKVKNEGNCTASWAFSATGAMEGQNFIKNHISVPLSEQQLLDCSGDYGHMSCTEGADMVHVFEYVMDHGLNKEEDYPYEAEQSRCRIKGKSAVNVTNYRKVHQSETALKEAVATVGPISVAIYGAPLQNYFHGIFQDENCYNDPIYLDLGVLAVGYGSNSGQKFWIIKTSWGDDWGESGYFRLARDVGQCGIALDASYPIL